MPAYNPKTLFVITVHSQNYRNNLFFDEVRRGINIEANLSGVNVEFLFGFNHKLATFERAAGIIFAPDGSTACYQLISGFKKQKKLPIVQIDNQIYDKKLAPPFDAFLGTDNFHGGKTTCEYLKSYLQKNSKILVIAGNRNLNFLSYNERLEGFKKEAGKYLKIIKIIYGEFDHHKTYTELHRYFSKTKDLPDAIFSFNDDSAIVARKVLDELTINKNIIITGFDGSASGRAALSKEQIICSYDQDPEILGRMALQTFIALADKRKQKKITLLKSTLLTKKNIGNTFYSGVINFLDRTLTPLSFRKRRYVISSFTSSSFPVQKSLFEYKNELTCPIYLSNKNNLVPLLEQIAADKFIVVSDNDRFLKTERKKLHKILKRNGLNVEVAGFPAGEKNKTPKTLVDLIEAILKKKVTKKSCLIVLGGGISGNVGGFAASIIYRGIRFVHLPTTLMHMVDSSTGGKQAVDSKYGKNAIGNFFEPEFILIDHKYLISLPVKELKNGLAECIKHALCQDKNFYNFILSNASQLLVSRSENKWKKVIKKSIELKLAVLNKDSYELNEGMILVYGHTIGNAIESATKFTLNHGEAIALGMLAAAKISVKMGLADELMIKQHEKIFRAVGLPIKLPKTISIDQIVNYLKFDKKYVDKPLSFILLRDLGKIYINKGVAPTEVSVKTIKSVIESMS